MGATGQVRASFAWNLGTVRDFDSAVCKAIPRHDQRWPGDGRGLLNREFRGCVCALRVTGRYSDGLNGFHGRHSNRRGVSGARIGLSAEEVGLRQSR
jgi:hypothetical protein